MEVSGQRHAPAISLPGKDSQFPLDRRLDETHSQSGRCEEEKVIVLPQN
jgi:hypothetical protein